MTVAVSDLSTRLPKPSRLPFSASALTDFSQRAAAASKKRLSAPHRAVLRRLGEIPLTVGGLGCIDTGVFQASTVAGWIVTGLSLILLEHLIADESA
jgi:hypothetical protein